MDWKNKKCQPCEGIGSPLPQKSIQEHLKNLEEWSYDESKQAIHAHFKFQNFLQTMSFVNAVAYIAEQEGHHPDLEISYSYANVYLTTHALNGVSENDFILATKISALK